MSSEFQVDTDQVRSAALQVEEYAGQCRAVDAGDALRGVTQGLPGTDTALAVETMVRSLASGVLAYAAHLEEMTAAGSDTVTAYLAADDNAAVTLTHLAGVPWAQ